MAIHNKTIEEASKEKAGSCLMEKKMEICSNGQCAKGAHIQVLNPTVPFRLCHISVNQRLRCDSQRQSLKGHSLYDHWGTDQECLFQDDNKNSSVQQAYRKITDDSKLASKGEVK